MECIHTIAYKGARSYTLRAANSAHSSEPRHCSGARAVEQQCSSCCFERCKLPAKLMGYTPPSKQEQRMRKRHSAETNMPSLEKHSNTISVSAQQFLIPLISCRRHWSSSGDSPCPTRSAYSGISCDSADSDGSDGFSSTAS